MVIWTPDGQMDIHTTLFDFSLHTSGETWTTFQRLLVGSSPVLLVPLALFGVERVVGALLLLDLGHLALGAAAARGPRVRVRVGVRVRVRGGVRAGVIGLR